MAKSAKKVTSNIEIEDVRMIWKNFTGKKTDFNAEGNRNFHVVIPIELAEALISDGWNVKEKPAREEGDEPFYHLEVSVKFEPFPPNITLLSSRGRTRLDEVTVQLLDTADIASCDIVIRPYNYDFNGKQGVKAYLKNLYVTIEEDSFAKKYADIPERA